MMNLSCTLGAIASALIPAVTLWASSVPAPEQRTVRSNGSKFTVLSVATQRSWKNAEDEWGRKPSGIAFALYGIKP